MDQIIIIKNINGSCSIIHPAPSAAVEYLGEVEIEQVSQVTGKNGKVTIKKEIVKVPCVLSRPMTIDEIIKKDVPEGAVFRIAAINDLPKNLDFRNAWTDDNPTKTVDVDMGKAAAIHLSRIRQRRTEKFAEMGFPVQLDADLEKAIIPEKTRAKLKALRDITEKLNLDKAKTPDDLKKIWPKELI